MTQQIVIKLNKKIFSPIINELMEQCSGTSQSISELIGKQIYFCYLLNSEKLPEFGNTSSLEVLYKTLKISKDKALIDFLKKYNKFLKDSGKR